MVSLLRERAKGTEEYGNPRGSLKLGHWAHMEGRPTRGRRSGQNQIMYDLVNLRKFTFKF